MGSLFYDHLERKKLGTSVEKNLKGKHRKAGKGEGEEVKSCRCLKKGCRYLEGGGEERPAWKYEGWGL